MIIISLGRGYVKSREYRQGTHAFEQKRIGGVLGNAGHSRVGDNCMDSMHILDMITIGFTDKFYVGCEGVGWLSSF